MSVDKKQHWRKSFDGDDYLILGGGLLTILIAFGLSAWGMSNNFSFITWLAWFVIPIGCLFLGGISAVGFFIVARIKQKKMSLFGAVLMMVLLVPAYFMHYGFLYQHTSFRVDDAGVEKIVPARELMSFFDFYKDEMTNRTYVDTKATDNEKSKAKPVGKWGYFYAIIEILGFLAGGLALLRICGEWEYCDPCGRYFMGKGLGLCTDKTVVQGLLDAIEAENEQSIQSALVSGWGNKVNPGENLKNGGHFKASISRCEMCHENSILEVLFQSARSSESKNIAKIQISKSLTLNLLGGM